jgi:hypothetical protein
MTGDFTREHEKGAGYYVMLLIHRYLLVRGSIPDVRVGPSYFRKQIVG